MTIKYILTAYYSKRDTYGNCHWAFQYRDCATGRQVQGTVSGGESNIAAIRLFLNGGSWPAPETYHWSSVELSIREFNAVTKEWPHAGCAPAELATFVRNTLLGRIT